MEVGFFIVGAPKCGTSALASYLSKNPAISFSEPKEPHFFSTDLPDKIKIRSFAHYESIFPAGEEVEIRGEGSIWYLYSRSAPSNIHKHNSAAKIIIMIRDPINFIESLHNQNVIGGHDKIRSVSKAVQESLNGEAEKFNLDYVELSRYEKFISVYEETFGKSNVLTILQEELKDNPRETYTKVLTFLGVGDDGQRDFSLVNERRTHKYRILEFLLTRNWSRLTQMIEPLRRFFNVGSFGIYKKIMDFNSKTTETEELPDDLVIKIKSTLEQDVRVLFGRIPEEKLRKYWKRFFL